ncbi:sigma-70 family RNA polymerase sigma factor [Micromonospora terminaliae]|uniref:Sigma-70 family RNA polymerase sigma factor n=1 Tax=Micromonospora terminaliae TaxID=1914461 RepID=A0AAJ3DJ72_9ACTN|nr:RNA polymerase sigma factor SigJ [Micromonospora terminaliae]NES28579.1 sigma-70 family RNA polymerase sigma factor [Micromonospora terminaliae]QGL45698.1 sigma-70 family RNA polymerase sigma factor [Micromonospora terminaliae]
MGTVGTRTEEIAGERRQLINVAYRLLGSVSEAEDAVQDAYARWYGLPPSRQEEIRSPGAWLTTVTSRICLDVLGSARARRERYVGAWLPEPLPDRTEWNHAGGADPGGPADPADQIVLDESVSMALLVVLESTTPAERVAFVLHEVFRYPFAEIADVLGRSPAACKQLAASARRRVSAARAPEPATGQAEVVRDVRKAWEARDIATLVGLLNPAAVMTADGGGVVGTVLHPVEGAARIARYLVAIADLAPGLELLERSVNGVPGLVAQRAGVVVTVASFDVSDGRVRRIWAVRNPEKLRPWAPEG